MDGRMDRWTDGWMICRVGVRDAGEGSRGKKGEGRGGKKGGVEGRGEGRRGEGRGGEVDVIIWSSLWTYESIVL